MLNTKKALFQTVELILFLFCSYEKMFSIQIIKSSVFSIIKHLLSIKEPLGVKKMIHHFIAVLTKYKIVLIFFLNEIFFPEIQSTRTH